MLAHPDRVESVVGTLELLVLVDVRRREQAPVVVVRPCVIGALEGLAQRSAGRLVVEKLRAPVGADVVEGAQVAIAVPGDEDRLAGNVTNEVVARRGHLVSSPDAEPTPEEQALALLRVDLGTRVV